MDGMALLASISVMATVAVTLFALYRANTAAAVQVRGRLEGLMRGASPVDIPVAAPLRNEPRPGPITKLLKGEYLEQVRRDLERADIGFHANEWVVLRLAMAVILPAVVLVVAGPSVLGVLGAMGAAIAGWLAPNYYLKMRQRRRVAKLEAQLPETLTLMSQSLKAGFGLLQSMSTAAEQMDHPIGTELERAIQEMNVGSSAEEALMALSERCGSYDLDIVVTAIVVQRTVGGNLSEILDKVAETMRERARIRGEIKTLTAQQSLTGLVIGLLPFGVGALFFVISPDYITPLFTETLGRVMIVAAIFLEAVGLMIIRRILNIEV